MVWRCASPPALSPVTVSECTIFLSLFLVALGAADINHFCESKLSLNSPHTGTLNPPLPDQVEHTGAMADHEALATQVPPEMLRHIEFLLASCRSVRFMCDDDTRDYLLCRLQSACRITELVLQNTSDALRQHHVYKYLIKRASLANGALHANTHCFYADSTTAMF